MNNNKKTGILYLLPTVIAEHTIDKVIPDYVKATANKTGYYLVENIRTARRFLSALNIAQPIESLQFEELNKNTDIHAIVKLLQPVVEGKNAAIISEAGCPGIADPGALAIRYAHAMNIKVMPLVGPSSILMALMASGFNGQSFVFHGYLPIDKGERAKKIKLMEKDAAKLDQTQLFMETPYRNEKLFRDLLKICQPDTMLCVAKNITGRDESIRSMSVKDWKNQPINLHKIPAVFLLYQQ